MTTRPTANTSTLLFMLVLIGQVYARSVTGRGVKPLGKLMREKVEARDFTPLLSATAKEWVLGHTGDKR
jgi:hypothetical protein